MNMSFIFVVVLTIRSVHYIVFCRCLFLSLSLFSFCQPICLNVTQISFSASSFNCSSTVCLLCTLSTSIALSKFRDSKISRIQPAPALDTDTNVNNNNNFGLNIRYLHADQQLDKNHAHKFGDGKKKSLSNHDILKYVYNKNKYFGDGAYRRREEAAKKCQTFFSFFLLWSNNSLFACLNYIYYPLNLYMRLYFMSARTRSHTHTLKHTRV